MRVKLLRVPVLMLLILPLFFNSECKKQPRCGCGTDVLHTFKNDLVKIIQYSESGNTIQFWYPVNPSATYYFCNPSKWIDTIKKMKKDNEDGIYLLLSGEVFYECNYVYMSGNYYSYVPPVFQVIVTSIEEDNYGKK